MLRQRLSFIDRKVMTIIIIFGILTLFYELCLEQLFVRITANKFKDAVPVVLDKNSTNLKKILFYTPFYSAYDYSFGYGNQPFIDNRCHVNNCFTTNNRHLLGKGIMLYRYNWQDRQFM